MGKRGPKPDVARYRRVAELRSRGLTLQQIGRFLGTSHQNVARLLVRSGWVPAVTCRDCGSPITRLQGQGRRSTNPVFCLSCLRKHPEATFGVRLWSLRLSAGLKRSALAQHSELSASSIRAYERDESQPTDTSLARLVGVLGHQLAPALTRRA
jgi:transcriptional regulator with XRE-family HTH domain